MVEELCTEFVFLHIEKHLVWLFCCRECLMGRGPWTVEAHDTHGGGVGGTIPPSMPRSN